MFPEVSPAFCRNPRFLAVFPQTLHIRRFPDYNVTVHFPGVPCPSKRPYWNRQHLVEELSVLLSSSLTQIGSMIRLDTEIANAESYVAIFQARFGKKIDLQTDLPHELSGFKVPALVLQPLVENALVHAFPKCTEPFVIRISADLSDQSDPSDPSDLFVTIRVSDNGPGMDPGHFAIIIRTLRSPGHSGKLTGLPGLSRRLRYYYPTSRLEIEPSDTGTTVVIRLPGGV